MSFGDIFSICCFCCIVIIAIGAIASILSPEEESTTTFTYDDAYEVDSSYDDLDDDSVEEDYYDYDTSDHSDDLYSDSDDSYYYSDYYDGGYGSSPGSHYY